jgi:hypothetical protein
VVLDCKSSILKLLAGGAFKHFSPVERSKRRGKKTSNYFAYSKDGVFSNVQAGPDRDRKAKTEE